MVSDLSYAQVKSDRLSGISNTRVIPNKGMQVELGQMMNCDVDYASPLLRKSSHIALRKGLSNVHEVRFGYNYDWSESDFEENYEWFSLGVKLEVANYKKLHISAIATWGFDLRTLFYENGPLYYLQLSAPWEYQFDDNFSLRSEVRFNHLYEQSDINFGIARKFGESLTLECGLVNNLFLAKRGDNGGRPYWRELSYANAALQANLGDVGAIDLGIMAPVFTGADQPNHSNGFFITGGLSIHIPH